MGERAVVRIDLLSLLSLFGGADGIGSASTDGSAIVAQLVSLFRLVGVQVPPLLEEAAANGGLASVDANALLLALEAVGEGFGIDLNQTISIPSGIPGLPPF